MATSKTRKKSPVKKSPARKSAVPEAPTSAAADSDASVLTRIRASLPRLSDVEVSAFRSLVADADCRARGLLTRAAETHRDVARALTRARIDAVVREHGAALGYDAPRLAFLLDLTASVGDAVAQQKKARGAGADQKFTVEQSGRAATAARNALLRRLKVLAGRNADSRTALDAARGSVETPTALIDSLRSLAKLAQAWLKRDDAQWAVLKRSTSFGAGEIDAAVRAAAAYEKARATSAETAPTPPDDGALNVLEGRMVLEFGALLDAVNDGREEGLGITALEVGPALRRALLQDAAKPAAKDAAPPAPPAP
jgi:hypothetical protein